MQHIPSARLWFRSADLDVIRRNELEGYAGQGPISLHVAFSRPAEGQKAYVQDRIIANQGEAWRLLQDDAVIYVRVDASTMVPVASRSFASVHCAESGSTEAAAESWLADLDAAGRYIADVWAS